MVLERRERSYVEGRVRAGLLEQNTVELMRELEVAEGLDAKGLPHDGVYLRWPGQTLRIPMTELTGRAITIYGQQQVVRRPDRRLRRARGGGALRGRGGRRA